MSSQQDFDDGGYGNDDSNLWGAQQPVVILDDDGNPLSTQPTDGSLWGATDPGASSAPATGTIDPNTGQPVDPNAAPIDPEGLGAGAQGGGAATGIGLPGGSNGPTPIPLPVDPTTAILASILLSNGNIFGGGNTSPGSVVNQVGNIATDPLGATTSALNNLGTNVSNAVMGPPAPTTIDPGAPQPIALPTGLGLDPGSGNGGGGTPTTVAQPVQTVTQTAPVQITGDAPVYNPPAVIPTPAPTPTPTPTPQPAPVQTVTQSAPSIGTAPTTPNPTGSAENTGTGTTVIPTPTPAPAPAPTGGTTPSDPGTTPGGSTTIIPTNTGSSGGTPGTGPGVTVPVVPIVPTTTPSMATTSAPDPRSYYNEGNTSLQALQSLFPGMSQLYGQASGAQSNTDYTNFQNILNQFAGTNNNSTSQQNLTNTANAQTAASNTALRQGNLSDVNNLAAGALQTQQSVNQPLYSALNTYSTAAGNNLAQLQATQATAGQLSPQDLETAQQAARAAWQARGLVNSPGAVGAEILNTNALQLQRQQQAIANTQTGLTNYGQSVSAQQANVFNPYSTILGSQYGQQTNNAGSNTALFGQSTGFSSGAQGNQTQLSQENPYNTYTNDLYGSNYNAANAQYLTGQNNAAALQGANTQSNAILTNNFLQSLAGLYGSGAFGGTPCWVAREIYGVLDPRWLLFRHWLLVAAPGSLRTAYLKNGEKCAAWLKNHPEAKPSIRTFMDATIHTYFMNTEDFTHALTN